MLKTISTSDLRSQLSDVLNQIVYGHVDYVVEKFGEPTVAIISVDDYHVLQDARRQHTAGTLREVIAQVRERHTHLDESELSMLIEEARADFHRIQNFTVDAN